MLRTHQGTRTTGRVYIHSAPPAICPHVEWALARALDRAVRLEWTAQAAAPGLLRTSAEWSGPAGTASRIARDLKEWHMLRFEVTEDASSGQDGERICYLPGRGIWRTAISANGDVMLGENQLRAMISQAASKEDLAERISAALGSSFDAELEPYRRAADGSAVTWLHRVG